MKKTVLFASLALSANLLSQASYAGPADAADAIDSVGSVRLKGFLGERLDAMIDRQVAAADADYLTATFREKTETKGWWQTEFWGKWMHAAVPSLAYAPSDRLRKSIDRSVDRILASQEKGGYIGNYPDALRCGEGWDVWGMKYTLMGLMHYYDLTQRARTGEGVGVGEGGGGDGGVGGDGGEGRVKRVERGERTLTAARRLCDYLIGELGPGGKRGRALWETGNWSGYASSSVLEPVIWLYRRTNERKYLDFASFIVKGMSEPEAGPRLVDLALKGVSVADRNGYGNTPDTSGKYVVKHNRWKAYEMMSCYQGLLDYAEEMEKVKGGGEGVGEIRLAAIKTAEDIIKEEINLAGGCASSEAWFHGAKKQHLPYVRLQETCVTITWMRLCEKLLALTDDPKWADQIERTFYNAYLGALRSDGSSFSAYTPLTGNRWHGMDHCYMHMDCCSANGPRGFFTFLRTFSRSSKDETTVNFYATAQLPGFEMYSRYPRTDFVRLVSHTQGPRRLRLRIPGWCPRATVRLNGAEQKGVVGGTYFILAREWKLGDVVELAFEMPVVAHRQARHVAFTRGPILLARDSRFGDGSLSEAFRAGLRDGQVLTSFAPVQTPSDDLWMAFSATLPLGSHHENPEGRYPRTVFFCDYVSAGNTWRQSDHYRTWFPEELEPNQK